jgi:ferredoxin
MAMSLRIRIDPTACTGHGVCSDLLPERIELDEWGFPIIQPEVPSSLAAPARRAVRACPVLALRLQRTQKNQREGNPGTVTVTDRRHHRREPDATDGVVGNERLTALTGVVLLIGFAIEGMTLLALHRLLTLHFFLGMLLIGPVLLKIGSTGYRFARYYTGAAPYVRKGPPAPFMRLLGPFVILTSLAVLGTGVMLGVAGPGSGPWLFFHKASFVLWFGCMTLHVLTYVWRLPCILLGTPDGHGGHAEPGVARMAVSGGGTRWLLVGAALAGGLVIALLTIHLVGPWDGRLFFH